MKPLSLKFTVILLMTEAVSFKIGVLKMAFRLTTLLKWDYNTGFSCEICKVFKNTFCTERLRWLLLLWFWNLCYGLLTLISFQFKMYMILINLVKVNHLIYCVQEKTPKIKRLIRYVKLYLLICLFSDNRNYLIIKVLKD